ncbi:acetyl-CoA carboxylase carboxyl transferase subunit alpha, partial [Acidobacteriota bacterium]
GSGGALAIGVGDSILMLQYSFYSVISPEGCVAILWKDKGTVSQAAENLKFLAEDLMGFGVIEEIIPEPPGGAHVDHETTFKNVDEVLHKTLTKVSKKPVEKMLEDRYNKFRKIGIFEQT